MQDYVTAERRGRESLRRFLLDLDAKEANDLEARTIGELSNVLRAPQSDHVVSGTSVKLSRLAARRRSASKHAKWLQRGSVSRTARALASCTAS
jgi:hypothetical protein